MRIASSTVNESSEADSDLRAGASLAPAVTRAAAILDVLAEHPSAATPLSDLARSLGLPKSSVANICGALVEAGLVRRVDAGFGLGRRLAELGGAYLSGVDQVHEFHDLAAQLPVASEETIQMALLDGLEVTYVARHDGRQPIRLASEIGRRLPASCTALGKATLASLDPDEISESERTLIGNLRLAHTRRLLVQLVGLQSASMDAWFEYLRLLFGDLSPEVERLIENDAALRDNYAKFTGLWGRELAEILRTQQRSAS